MKSSRKFTLRPIRQGYSQQKDEIFLEIDPGTAFGKGTHPTTSMCMNMIGYYLKEWDTVLDVGTGSGILMITAAKLGAGKVLGIDKSEVTMEIARKNLMLNKIEEKRYKIRTGHLVEGVNEQFDLVVANILTETIVALLDNIENVIKKTGIFICSGMLEGSSHRVLTKMKAVGFEILETRIRGNWVSIAGKQRR